MQKLTQRPSRVARAGSSPRSDSYHRHHAAHGQCGAQWELCALATYAGDMRAELEIYDGLRAQTSDFVDRINTVTYQQAYEELGEESQDRSEV